MGPAERNARLEEVLRELERRFGWRAAFRLRERAEFFTPGLQRDGWSVSTGSLGLDLQTGANGLPRGRISEVFGPDGGGLPGLVAHILAAGQRNTGLAALVDCSCAGDDGVLRAGGVQLEDLLLTVPSGAREALKVAELLLMARALDVMVLDRIDALGLPDLTLSAALGRLQLALKGAPTALVVTSRAMDARQLRPAGRALAHYASVRVQIQPVAVRQRLGGVVGSVRVRASVVKNKVGSPGGTAEFDITPGAGIDRAAELLALGRDMGLITYGLAGFRFGVHNLGLGDQRARDAIDADPTLADALESAIRAATSARANVS